MPSTARVQLPDLMSVELFDMRLRGSLITPWDEEYERARGLWHGAVDRRPALIARCADREDVTLALRFAREHAMPLSIRGGDCGAPGRATDGGGLVIDLSPIADGAEHVCEQLRAAGILEAPGRPGQSLLTQP